MAKSKINLQPLISRDGKVEQNNTQDSENFLKTMGKLGFRNAADFNTFLRSDTGKIVQSIMSSTINEQARNEELQKQLMMDELMRKKSRLWALFMGLMHKRKARAKALQRSAYEQLQQDHKEKHTENPNDTVETASMEIPFELYQRSLNQLQHARDQLLESAKSVEEQLETLANDEAMMVMEHDLANKHLSEVNQKDIDTLKNEAQDLHQLSAQKLIEAQQLLDVNKGAEARLALVQHRALKVKQAATLEKLEFANPSNEKLYDYCDANGQSATNYQQCQFIIPKAMNMQLITINGEPLLVPKQLIENKANANHLNPQQKTEGRNAFQQHHHKICSVANLVGQNQRKEKLEFSKRATPLKEKCERLRTEIAFVQGQIHVVETALANLPTPKPAPNSKPEIEPQNKQQASSYLTHLVKLMRLDPSKKQVSEFQKAVKTEFGKDVSEAQQKQLNDEIRPGQTILQPKMEKIIRMLHNMGSGTHTEQQLETRSKLTPFDVRPSPLKNR